MSKCRYSKVRVSLVYYLLMKVSAQYDMVSLNVIAGLLLKNIFCEFKFSTETRLITRELLSFDSITKNNGIYFEGHLAIYDREQTKVVERQISLLASMCHRT